MVLSLIMSSRSASKNSRTRFRFVFEENTSNSFTYYEWLDIKAENSVTHSNDILMLQFFQELHFSYGRHIESILELTDFDLFDGDLSTSGDLLAFVHDSVCTLLTSRT